MDREKSEPIDAVDRQMAAVLAAKTEAERLQIAWAMWRSARRMLRNVVAAEHPSWTAEQVEAEVSRRMQRGT